MSTYRNVIANGLPEPEGMDWSAVAGTVTLVQDDDGVRARITGPGFTRVYPAQSYSSLAADGQWVALTLQARHDGAAPLALEVDADEDSARVDFATLTVAPGGWQTFTRVAEVLADGVLDLSLRATLAAGQALDVRRVVAAICPTQAEATDVVAARGFWDGNASALTRPDLTDEYAWLGAPFGSASTWTRIIGPRAATGAVGVALVIDGQEVPCHYGAGEQPDDAYGLSGLTTTWGRSGIIGNPEASTCAFELADPPGGRHYRNVVSMGSRVQVLALGEAVGIAGQAANRDPGFATGTNPWTVVPTSPDPVSWAMDTTHATDSHSLALGIPFIGDGATTHTATALLAYGPWYSPGVVVQGGGGLPLWADDPRSGEAGEPWTLAIWATVPVGQTVTLSTAWVAAGGREAQSLAKASASDEYLDSVVIVGDGAPHLYALNRTSPAPDRYLVPVITLHDVPTSQATPAIWLDSVSTYPPVGSRVVRVAVFDGKVTDLEVVPPADGDDEPTVSVQCVDFVSDLSQLDTGDQPWPQEGWSSRWQRLVAGVTREYPGAGVLMFVDEAMPNVILAPRDVDSTDWWSLLSDFAQSTGSTLWGLYTPDGPAIYVERPTSRVDPEYLTLAVVEGEIRLVDADVDPGEQEGVTVIPACDVVRDPVRWTQDTADVYSRVKITYVVPASGSVEATTATVLVVESAAEVTNGVRQLSVETELISASDATSLGAEWLERTSLAYWRAGGVHIDDDGLLSQAATDILLPLLDAATRAGRGLLLTDLPTWSPVPSDTLAAYLEGGTYAYVDGRWSLDLAISTARGTQAGSLAWDDLVPTWTWAMLDPSIRWTDLRGVMPPAP